MYRMSGTTVGSPAPAASDTNLSLARATDWPGRRVRLECRLALRPVVVTGLADGELLRAGEARRHRGVGAGHVLVVVDAEQPDPALLAEGQSDEAAELDEFGLGEVLAEPLPELVEVLLAPGDRLRVCEGSLLAVVVLVRGLEVQQLVVLRLLQSGGRRLHGALVAAELALDRPRDVDPAKVLDRVVADALVEGRLPGVGEGPERVRRMGTDRRALRPRGAITSAAVHLLLHALVHALQRDVADVRVGHGGYVLSSSRTHSGFVAGTQTITIGTESRALWSVQGCRRIAFVLRSWWVPELRESRPVGRLLADEHAIRRDRNELLRQRTRGSDRAGASRLHQLRGRSL